MEFDAATLLQYACERFEMKQYDDALDAFILTYNMGYEQEWILQNIYECYMQGNSEEFQKAYQKQGMFKKIPFEDCLLDFIPYRDGEYYIFDKERQMFLGVFSISEIENAEIDPVLNELEFSAVVTEIDWNLNALKTILTEKSQRKIYVVCHDVKRCMSYWKIPEMTECLERVKLFESRENVQQYFHENTAEYLPKIPYGTEEIRDAFEKMIAQEHQYRITPEGRNTSNILLTIGIPTFDRGNLILDRIKNLREMLYDSEIEIAISKNGTHYYQEEYKSIEKIPDARINYVGYDENLNMSTNWQNVIHIAHGKFVLMVSDEDDVILEALEYYLKFLSAHEKLGMVRAKTVLQYAGICESKYFDKGKEAFLGGFLGQNYLSGAIYNRQFFLETDIKYWDDHYSENMFYHLYPHMWWQAVLAFQGDYAEEAVYLIREGESVLWEQFERYRKEQVSELEIYFDEETSLSFVSTYEGRLEQFKGAVELIKDFEILDDLTKVNALTLLIAKMSYLMNMVREGWNYKVEEFPDWLSKLVDEAMIAVDELCTSTEYKRIVLNNVLTIVKNMQSKCLE